MQANRFRVVPCRITVLLTWLFGITHDDIIKWKHFPSKWPFVRGIHRSPVNSPHKGLWRGALMFSLVCAWINGWINNREAGDLRRHYSHCDVTLMRPAIVGLIRTRCFLCVHSKFTTHALLFFVTWWRHQMETFFALLFLCGGNSPVCGEFLAQRPLTRSFDVFLTTLSTNGWVNNREAGDLRRHRAHYDVIVMIWCNSAQFHSLTRRVLNIHNHNECKLNTY